MFTTCLHCHRSLGTNQVIEPFPVGKRLAFDGERGRVGTICPYRAYWNLAPIEELCEAPGEAAVRLLANPALGIGQHGDSLSGRPRDITRWQVRLGAETTPHEADERRAIAGELGELYACWEEAEPVIELPTRFEVRRARR